MAIHGSIKGAWVQLNVRVPVKLFKQLKARAELEDRPVSRLVRRALFESLEAKRRAEMNRPEPTEDVENADG